MPEIKNTFRGGKMNKDLNERLVPKGEYRDALNIQVNTSDGSDVGSVQNILSNEKVYDLASNILEPVCVGAVVDSENNKFYWFVKGDDKDLIIEYSDQQTRLIVVDVNKDVLKFTGEIITGINILDGMLFWTDNNSEPKKINIENCALGLNKNNPYTTQTKLHNFFQDTVLGPNSPYTDSNVDLLEEHITVIKRAPYNPPTIELISPDNFNQPGIIQNFRFADSNGVLWGTGSYPGSQSTVDGPLANNPTSDLDINMLIYNSSSTQDYVISAGETIINLKSVANNDIGYDGNSDGLVDSLNQNFNQEFSYGDDYDIRLKITSISLSQSSAPANSPLSGYIDIHCEIISIKPGTTPNFSAWVVNFEQASDTLFELKFPRFAYRYKYIDGEYSAFSPFSEVAFNASTYSHDSVKGYNFGMKNYLKSVKISEFVPIETTYTSNSKTVYLSREIPHDVIGVDLLYKESNSPSVYIVDSITKNIDSEWLASGGTFGNGVYELTSDTISKLLPSNQLLRSFDSVPKKALSQEIIGNRLMYGNYTQNMDMNTGFENLYSVDLDFSYKNRSTVIDDVGVPSLKTLRSYQLGVVYEDKYGRQTPVLTNKNATINLPISQSATPSQFEAKINSLHPIEAESYKFFIKETSTEYYNLALNRWYNALDGNIWLSFNSIDRNKVDEETYLYLKKGHGSDIAIKTPNKYRIVSIENEAPDYIKTKRSSLGNIEHTTTGGTLLFNEFTFLPIKDKTEFRLNTINVEASGFADITSKSNLEMVLTRPSTNNTSDRYEISNAVKDVLNPVSYIITIKGKFKSDVNFIEDSSSTASLPVIANGVFLEITEGKIENKPEFDGKFFVKIFKDFNISTFILPFSNNGAGLAVTHQEPLYYYNTSVSDLPSLSGGNQWSSLSRNGGGSYFYHNAATDAQIHFGNGLITDTTAIDGPKWFIDKLPHEGPAAYNSTTGGLISMLSDPQHPGDESGLNQGVNGFDIDISYSGIVTPMSFNSGNVSVDRMQDMNDKIGWAVGQSGNSSTDEEITMVSNLAKGKRFYFADDADKIIYNIVNVQVFDLYNYMNHLTDWASNGAAYVHPTNRRKTWRLTLDKEISTQNYNPTITASSTNAVGINFVDNLKDKDGAVDVTKNPAIFETKPKNTENLEIYHEASRSYDVNGSNTTVSNGDTIKWFNCFAFGNGVESNRIQDDFNAVFIDNGPKVSTVFEGEYKEERIKSRLIFSGIYNSKNSVNRTNEFIIAEKITKDLNPIHGGIQKLHARDTDLVVLCEDKVFKVLANKDALFNADGNFQLTSNENVLGQVIPFSGDYGISTDPESFANEAYRSYFTDKKRGVVLRLSKDGLTPISEYGMSDYFSDNLKDTQRIVGSYDTKKNNYNLTLTKTGFSKASAITITYDEKVRGWSSFKSFQPELGISLNSDYYTFWLGSPWLHNVGPTYNTFYNTPYSSTVTFLLNDASGSIKNFNTLNYEGSQSQVQTNTNDANYHNLTSEIGWSADYISTDLEQGYVNEFIKKEGKWFNYIKGEESSVLTNQFSFQGLGLASPVGSSPTMFSLTIGDLTADEDPTI